MNISDPDILDLFQKASPSSRHSFLTALSSHLRPSDWHHLHGLLSRRSYYIDILTLLPVELSLQVLQYIPPQQLILLRNVSRSYNTLLTSSEVCRFLVYRFFPLSASAHSDSWRTLFDNLLSQRLSLMRCEPSRIETTTISISSRAVTSFHASTCTFASVIGDHQIQVHSFSPEIHPLLPPKPTHNRSGIDKIALSASIVAAVTRFGTCQVWNLSTHATHSFRLPNVCVSSFRADGSTVAILLGNELLIHNAATKKTRNSILALPLQQRRDLGELIVNETGNRVWVISGSGLHRKVYITSQSLDTGDTVGVAEEFETVHAGKFKLYGVGNGVWLLQFLNLGLFTRSFEVTQIKIDVHKQIFSKSFYPVDFPRPPSGKGSMYTAGATCVWGSLSWVCHRMPEENLVGVTAMVGVWEHSMMQGRYYSMQAMGGWELGWEWGGVSDGLMVILRKDLFGNEGVVVLRFDGVYEREPSIAGAGRGAKCPSGSGRRLSSTAVCSCS